MVIVLGENITVHRFARIKVGDPNWTVATTKRIEGSAESLSTAQGNNEV
jgi:elongation factor Ts